MGLKEVWEGKMVAVWWGEGLRRIGGVGGSVGGVGFKALIHRLHVQLPTGFI